MTGSGSPVVTAVLYRWHADHKSEAAYDTLLDPLRPFFDLRLHPVDWKVSPEALDHTDEPAVFFFVPPPFASIRSLRRPITWVPMWDRARTYSPRFWASLPHNLRIVSFSDALSRRTRAAGLRTLDIRFYRDPQTLFPTRWDGQRVAFYWNRSGLVSPRFLERWCAVLKIDRLLFKAHMDPFMPERLYFDLPPRLGDTVVEPIPHTEDREDFFGLIARTNVFLAPRQYEGIGMTFIEALGRGNAVFAFDGATMNEYIRSGETGYLLPHQQPPPVRTLSTFHRKLQRRGIRVPVPSPFNLTDEQPWDEISRLDLAALGTQAREAHAKGYAAWRESLPRYAEFLSGHYDRD